jgi:hypothetical protein
MTILIVIKIMYKDMLIVAYCDLMGYLPGCGFNGLITRINGYLCNLGQINRLVGESGGLA